MNNRRRGHNWERTCMSYLSRLFPNIKTSRYASKMQDDLKVDLCFTGKYNFQCKLANKKIDYATILDEMPKDEQVNVILHKLTNKVNERFLSVGEYAILPLNEFIKLIENEEGESTVSSGH